jgi:phenylacetate-coenzyme A ligase PaaK-like adenylate-forming protein
VTFEPEVETLPREALRDLQAERLRSLVAYVKERVPLYRERLAGVEPDDITSVDDLGRLPLTRKDDLRDTYPFGMFAVPRAEVMRIHASSGTTGKLTMVGYTAADVDLFARVNARSLAMAGAEPGMVLHNAYGYGLFTGGLGLHDGGERLGMVVVPVSGGMTERQLMLITDFRPEVISCTPSYALTLAQSLPGARCLAGGDQPPLRAARRRALDGGDAARDRRRPRRAQHEHLRAFRGDRPRRLVRVRRGARRLARQRGPLPPRDRRPGDG